MEEPGEPVGINAWIALDDMSIEYGGGFALAVGSHSSSWKEEAYRSIGSTHSFPNGGFNSSRDILQNRPGNGTCNMEHTAPHLHKRMEETKRVYDIKGEHNLVFAIVCVACLERFGASGYITYLSLQSMTSNCETL